MIDFKVEIKKSVEKELINLPKDYVDTITFKIKSLSKNPFPERNKKLKGFESLYRIRLGDYRILYTVNTKSKVITIQSINHRKDVYKNL
ncbi:MAG: type II toxin-antitoxin system RelE/ParE family toxin [bacterium]